jgi:ATP-binding cassette, subfamily B, bacterial PglK
MTAESSHSGEAGRTSSVARLWRMLTPAQKRTAGGLLAAMLLGTVLEALGVGMIIPLLSVMAQRDVLAAYPSLYEWLGRPTTPALVIYVMLALVVIYAVKAFYLALVAWWQSSFVFGVQVSLSARLFDGYLRQPYTFHLQRNSAELIRNVITETSQLSHVATIPGIMLLSEGLVIVAISALLVAMEPIPATVVVAVVAIVALGFHRLTSLRLLRWGEARQLHEMLRIQHLQQGLGGVKDVKVLGREAQFLARYMTHDRGVAAVQERQLTLAALPRLWLELLGAIGLTVLVITMLAGGRPLEALVPTVGLFSAAAFRLMPSVSKVVTAVQNLRYARPVIDTLTTELALSEAAPRPADAGGLPFQEALRLTNVSYTYPGSTEPALKDIDLSIARGKSIGFVGGSGAGKSTLIDVILGLLAPTRGAVTVDGTDIRTNVRGWQSQVGYVPQTIYLTDDTLRANVAFGLRPDEIDDESVWRALRAAQLEEFVRTLPEQLESVVGERGVRLSGGQKQRIGIARALYYDPPVLVLDEATSSLDTTTEQGLMEAVGALRGRKTILIVAHRASTVEDCDVIVRLGRGRIVGTGLTPTLAERQRADG